MRVTIHRQHMRALLFGFQRLLDGLQHRPLYTKKALATKWDESLRVTTQV